MRFFVCLFHPEYRQISKAARRPYESMARSRGLSFGWRLIGQVPTLLGGADVDADPALVATVGDWVALGTVRLDNRADLERWSGVGHRALSDLELVLRTVAQHGTKYVGQFLGDFAFVVLNPITRTAVAACDPFAVKRLYYAERNGLFAFASRAQVLALDEHYDVQYLAERVAACTSSLGRTAFADVKALPPASMAVIEGGRLTVREYWSPYAAASRQPGVMPEREAVATCRDLVTEAVRLRLGDGAATWAQLSGGMDSSSVVSIAQSLAKTGVVVQGLAGTVTYVDHHGTGADEREYSDAVVRDWHVRNETIEDFPVWHDDLYAMPYLDQPCSSLMYFGRDRRLSAIVRNAGGRVLLTGVGGDNAFTGNLFFFADWLAHGRIGTSLGEMGRWAATGRVSFWELAYRNAFLPLLPRAFRHRLVSEVGTAPPWVEHDVAVRYGLRERAVSPAAYDGPIGGKYPYALAAIVAALGGALSFDIIEEDLDVRHPFLYRPLVEFALQLPPALCAQPHARKWVLREAMRGILPEVVRTRVGKGVPNGLMAWSLVAHRGLLEPLLRDPILAQLGIVNPTRLRAGFGLALEEHENRRRLFAAMQELLAIEAWLEMRSGQWPRGEFMHQPEAHQTYRPSA